MNTPLRFPRYRLETALAVCLCLMTENLFATAVPFSSANTVDGMFDGAHSVFAADGDGDTDVLGAASNSNEIIWWENTAGDGSAWAEHVVTGTFAFAASVFAADVDGDGDTDVLGAAIDAGAITWWENTAGDGSTWTEHSVDAAFAGAISVIAADFDGDGDMDVLGGAAFVGDISWWENLSGDGSAWTKHAVAASDQDIHNRIH